MLIGMNIKRVIQINSINIKDNKNFNYLLKNIKFIEKPEFDCIIDQMQVLDKNSYDIVNKLEFIDLKFKI